MTTNIPVNLPEGCPVTDYDNNMRRPVEGYFALLDELREASPRYWSTHQQGFWMLTRFDDIRAAYQDSETFTSKSIIVTDPDPAYMWVPTMVDGPIHTKYRQLLNAYFSPIAVGKLEEQNRRIAAELVKEIVPRGSCDLAIDFCAEYPTRAFFTLAGFDQSDAPTLSEWVVTVFRNMHNPDGRREQADAMDNIRNYFKGVIADRRLAPRDPASDLTSNLLAARLDGEPLDEETMLNILGVIIMAGLDTTKSQLGYSFYHLAQYEQDRQRLLDDPSLVASFVEESLRYYTIVEPGRKLGRDVEFAGCPMREGDMVLLDLGSACRDPRVFPDADKFVIDRPNNRHVAFAPGPHRCLGSHLARQELTLAIEEWHKAIPHYELANVEPLTEHGGQRGVDSIPVRWTLN